MSGQRLLLFTCLVWASCTRNDLSSSPLGQGPRAKAEQALEARAAEIARQHSLKQARLAERQRDYDRQRRRKDKDKPKRQRLAEHERQRSKIAASKDKDSNLAVASLDAGAQSDKNQPIAAKANLSDWIGRWQGNDTTRYLIEGLDERKFDDDQAVVRVQEESSDTVALVLVDSSNGEDLCSLTAKVTGKSAVVQPGQSCFSASDQGIEATVTEGTARLEDEHLVLDASLDTTLQGPGPTQHGTIEYHFEGSR